MPTKRCVVCLLTAVLSVACGSDEPSIVFEIGGIGDATQLDLLVKRYLDDVHVEVYELEPLLLEDGAREVSLLVELPAGRYAFHFVATGGLGSPAADTRCHRIDGPVVDSDVQLLALGPELDADGDTFPDDVRAYCSARTALGQPCDMDCAEPAYLALIDCNPPADLEPGAGCPDIPRDARWNPFEVDECSSCFDEDCYGGDIPCEDLDGDGFLTSVDCDDQDPNVNPAAEEGCSNDDPLRCPGCADGVDTDCDGVVDQGCFPDDLDHDGLSAAEDCNDCDPGVGPGATEVCDNGIDEDCQGPADGDLACDPEDQDGDGFAALPFGEDCDDTDPRIYPGAPDRCGDLVAQNCDSDRDCDADGDGDNFDEGADCGPGDPEIHPWATEACDEEGVDEDCDGVVNEVIDRTGRAGCAYDPEAATWFEIDLSSDMDHCGACRHRCQGSTWSEGDRCEGGQCQCYLGGPCEGSLRDWCCPGVGCVDLTTGCCDDSDCTTLRNPDCSGHACTCDAQGTPCGAGEVCCATEGCVAGDCCADSDCAGTAVCGGGGPNVCG